MVFRLVLDTCELGLEAILLRSRRWVKPLTVPLVFRRLLRR